MLGSCNWLQALIAAGAMSLRDQPSDDNDIRMDTLQIYQKYEPHGWLRCELKFNKIKH